MSQESILFFGGLLLIVVGLIVWICRPNAQPAKIMIGRPDFGINLDVPAIAVMLIGAAITYKSRDWHVDPKPPITMIACYAEKRGMCEGHYDLYYDCGFWQNVPNIAEVLVKNVCNGPSKSISHLVGHSGGACGINSLRVVCAEK